MFKPTENQDNAIKNMERVIGLEEHQHEDCFETKDQFQKYFEELSNKIKDSIKQWKKSKNFKNAVKLWKIDIQKVYEKKKNDILNYYSNPKILKEKALEYQSKWSASIWKVKIWMLKKTNNNKDLVDDVLDTMIILEDYIIENFIRNWLNNWKWLDQLKGKLIYIKLFNKNTVEKIIEEKFQENIVNEKVIKRIIEKAQRQKKNVFQIKWLLYPVLKYQEDYTLLIENYIEKFYDNEKEHENLLKEYEKAKNKFSEKQQIIQYLRKKWYKYQEINNIIN